LNQTQVHGDNIQINIPWICLMVSNKTVESNTGRVHLLKLGEGEWNFCSTYGWWCLFFKISSPFANTLVHIVYVDRIMFQKYTYGKLVVITRYFTRLSKKFSFLSQNSLYLFWECFFIQLKINFSSLKNIQLNKIARFSGQRPALPEQRADIVLVKQIYNYKRSTIL